MADYSNLENRLYSDLENPQNDYSNIGDDGDHNGDAPRRDSDNDSQSGRSDHGSAGHQNNRDGHHDDHSEHDREGDRIDREDNQSDREDGRSESRIVNDREGSLHGSDDGVRHQHDGPRDHADDVYDSLDESNVYHELLAQAEDQENYYNSAEHDRKSDDGQSDGEEGHRRTVQRESGEVARAVDYEDVIYDELKHRSDSEGSEKGEHARGHERVSDDLDGDLGIKDEHTHEHGHERRGSHESDEAEKRKSSDDEGIKRQSTSTAPASSGKFVLRTSRKADALHVVRRIRSSTSAEDNPEMDELVTIIRSTDHDFADDDNLEDAKQKEKIKSVITSKLIHQFEQGLASEEAFNELHGEHSIAESSKVNDSYSSRTVVKTTVVKTTVKAEATSPVSPKSPSIPKSPSGSDVMDISRSSSSSSVSSSSRVHLTYNSQHSNSGMTKSFTNAPGQQVNTSRHSANEPPKTPEEGTVPGWKAEIEMRKKTKSHVPTQKPKEPMKMSEVPEWKKQLQEKNKMKKLSSSDEPEISLAKVTTVEMDRLKHEMVINHGVRGDSMPEWARLADEKKKTVSH